MKMIKMLNLQTTEIKNIPTTESEAKEIKRKSFDEGWWKGFAMAFVCMMACSIVGGINNSKLD